MLMRQLEWVLSWKTKGLASPWGFSVSPPPGWGEGLEIEFDHLASDSIRCA